jgi:hypothetical protein
MFGFKSRPRNASSGSEGYRNSQVLVASSILTFIDEHGFSESTTLVGGQFCSGIVTTLDDLAVFDVDSDHLARAKKPYLDLIATAVEMYGEGEFAFVPLVSDFKRLALEQSAR